MAESSSQDDLGYCKGSREEKTKMLESKCEQSKSNKRKPRDQNNHHRIDINERVQALQQAMEKANYTKDTHGHKMDKNDPNYGTPQEGSWTALRGQKAHSHVHKEILELCEFIYMHSHEDEDERSRMLFGDLFKLYTRISDKVVGILLRARKYELVHFEPEILFQGQDDDEPVTLMKPMQEIYDIYNKHKSFSISKIE